MMLAYGDDSSDSDARRVWTVGVAIGGEDNWKELEEKWCARCGGVPFHANECESGWGDFKTVEHGGVRTREENRSLYKDLVTLIVESQIAGFGEAIDMVAQAAILPGTLHLTYCTAFDRALVHVFETCRRIGHMATFEFDISPSNEGNAGYAYQLFRDSDPQAANHFFHKISFACCRENSRLQVADLIAYESMKMLANWLSQTKRRRGSHDALEATGRFVFNNYSSGWFADHKAQLQRWAPAIKEFGDEYAAWRKETGRIHNMNNQLEFARLREKAKLDSGKV